MRWARSGSGGTDPEAFLGIELAKPPSGRRGLRGREVPVRQTRELLSEADRRGPVPAATAAAAAVLSTAHAAHIAAPVLGVLTVPDVVQIEGAEEACRRDHNVLRGGNVVLAHFGLRGFDGHNDARGVGELAPRSGRRAATHSCRHPIGEKRVLAAVDWARRAGGARQDHSWPARRGPTRRPGWEAGNSGGRPARPGGRRSPPTAHSAIRRPRGRVRIGLTCLWAVRRRRRSRLRTFRGWIRQQGETSWVGTSFAAPEV